MQQEQIILLYKFSEEAHCYENILRKIITSNAVQYHKMKINWLIQSSK